MAEDKEQVSSLREMLRDHINESRSERSVILNEITAIKTHGIYTKETLQAHDKAIDRLKSDNNTQKGVVKALLWVVSALGLTGIEELIRNGLK